MISVSVVPISSLTQHGLHHSLNVQSAPMFTLSPRRRRQTTHKLKRTFTLDRVTIGSHSNLLNKHNNAYTQSCLALHVQPTKQNSAINFLQKQNLAFTFKLRIRKSHESYVPLGLCLSKPQGLAPSGHLWCWDLMIPLRGPLRGKLAQYVQN